MCDDMMDDIKKYQEFIYKREDVKPYLKELDTILQLINLVGQELDDKIDEVLFNFFNIKSTSEFRTLSDKKLEDLKLFEMYIYNELEEL